MRIIEFFYSVLIIKHSRGRIEINPMFRNIFSVFILIPLKSAIIGDYCLPHNNVLFFLRYIPTRRAK
jgi:hypothetical protein